MKSYCENTKKATSDSNHDPLFYTSYLNHKNKILQRNHNWEILIKIQLKFSICIMFILNLYAK